MKAVRDVFICWLPCDGLGADGVLRTCSRIELVGSERGCIAVFLVVS
jgi:hypothetical protein